MTEENKPIPCPEWCDDPATHVDSDFRIHDSRALVVPDPSSIAAYAQQTNNHGVLLPAVVKVSVEDGQHQDGSVKRSRVELPVDQARILSLIINDAAKAGIKNVRALGKGIGGLAALITEPEADQEAEAG